MSLEGIIILIALGTILVIIVLIFRSLEAKNRSSGEVLTWIQELNRRLDSNNQSFDIRIQETMKMFHSRLDHSTAVVSQLQKNVGEFAAVGNSMKELQELLQSPKLRGNIGEHILKELLTQYFPQDAFALQYTFASGEKVDAILKTSQGLIPIDAKFPLENFRKLYDVMSTDDKVTIRKAFARDVRKHIQDIHTKYIRTQEDTVDYALMYIPSEAVYYEVINDSELFDFSTKKRVVPVSPMSFYAYMKAILMSFEGQKVEKQAKEILQLLQSLNHDYSRVEEVVSVLGKHVTSAYNQIGNVNKVLGQLGQKIDSAKQMSSPVKETLPPAKTEESKLY